MCPAKVWLRLIAAFAASLLESRLSIRGAVTRSRDGFCWAVYGLRFGFGADGTMKPYGTRGKGNSLHPKSNPQPYVEHEAFVPKSSKVVNS